jgi:hypothetical protein
MRLAKSWHGGSRGGSDADMGEEKLEEAARRRRRMARKRRTTTLIKSINPHLAGGEKQKYVSFNENLMFFLKI